MKVYCKNCKYSQVLKNADHYYCTFTKKINNEYNGLTTSINYSKENAEGKCKKYKRKWWNFWIKPTS